MTNTVYPINKGINAGLEFKGLKSQYILYLGGGLVGVLILFAFLYVLGVNTYLCLLIAISGGGGLFIYTYRLNNKYGEHGMMRKAAEKRIPRVIHCYSRKTLTNSSVSRIENSKRIV
jgi:hypothetical protein